MSTQDCCYEKEHYVCIHCGKENNALYKFYQNGIFNLSRCNFCQKIVDNYIEYEFTLIFLDLLLHKSKAFHHILFNVKNYAFKNLLVLVVLLSETCVKWANVSHLLTFDILYVYVIFSISALGFFVYILMMMSFLLFYCWKVGFKTNNLQSLINVLLIGSYGKVFNMASTIWCSQDVLLSSVVLNLFVITTTVKALNVYTKICQVNLVIFVLISLTISISVSSLAMELLVTKSS